MASVYDESGAVLGPPQFRLRTLMLAVTLCCVVFALMAAVGPLWSLVLLLFLALIGGHVFGNALGTRLCDLAPSRHPSANPPHAPTAAMAGSERLREHTGLSRAMFVSAAFGALVGSTAGGIALACVEWEPMGITGLVLGTLSSGVLGMFFAFLAASFFSVFRRAWAEALDDHEA